MEQNKYSLEVKESNMELKDIDIILKSVGNDKEIKTNNILKSLQELNIHPLKVKGRGMFNFSYNGKTFVKIMMPLQMRRLMVNDVAKQILAKQVNSALGIK